ncbi:hypothetical protein E4680_11690 [Candidatus Macondimonas diazotrophica]|uniref:Uncharacterized protein n=2 Tax=Candidatus Macondimonas diazotrophica TaxID=2305248 RepID=A0A4Z0F6Q9_9GAMM|nr:hypothetical protein E4680_11690 [Candidatus Macondimonas diazotrophica]
MLSRIKYTSKKNNIPFNLTPDDIPFLPDKCPVLGIKLNFRNGKGWKRDRPSIDRIRPELGYIKGNVRVISARANLLKNDATVEELEAVLEDLKRIRRDDKDSDIRP